MFDPEQTTSDFVDIGDSGTIIVSSTSSYGEGGYGTGTYGGGGSVVTVSSPDTVWTDITTP